MALVNADSEFLMVDVGTNGRVSDGGVFAQTKFASKLFSKQLNLPDASAIVEDEENIPFVFVGDDAFPLRPDLLKPYKYEHLTAEQEHFNETLSKARVKVEHAFGILAGRFRVLLTTMLLSPEKAAIITLSCCYLHNLLMRSTGSYNYNDNTQPLRDLSSIQPSNSRNASNEAKAVRNQFCRVLCEQ